jgi:hypothetical protein
MPADQRIGLDVPQNIAPLEHSAQGCHQPPCGIVCSSWFNLPLLKQRQLLPEEQILGCKRTPGPSSDREKTTDIEQYDGRSNQAVPDSGEAKPAARDMKAQDRTLRRTLSGTALEFLRTTSVLS